MPNLRGLLQPFSDELLPELLLAAVVSGLVITIVHRMDFDYGMAAVIIGSLLVSHHAGPQDAALLIPAFLIVAGRTTTTAVNQLSLVLFTPLPYLFLTYGHGLAALAVLPVMALLLAMVIETRRGTVLAWA